MPSSRSLEIRRIVRERLSVFDTQPVKTPSTQDTYALLANVTENALLAMKEGRDDDARRNLLFLLTAFRWELNTFQVNNSARSGVIHG